MFKRIGYLWGLASWKHFIIAEVVSFELPALSCSSLSWFISFQVASSPADYWFECIAPHVVTVLPACFCLGSVRTLCTYVVLLKRLGEWVCVCTASRLMSQTHTLKRDRQTTITAEHLTAPQMIMLMTIMAFFLACYFNFFVCGFTFPYFKNPTCWTL